MYYVRGGAYLAFGHDFVPLMLPAMENMNMPVTIPPHILIVDDDPQIRDLLREYFTSNELRVSVTSSGKEVTGILVDHSIDLVVLDLRLAGEDGMVLARRLHEESAIPIIILTGLRDEADRIMGLELGADDYLTKPFSHESFWPAFERS